MFANARLANIRIEIDRASALAFVVVGSILFYANATSACTCDPAAFERTTAQHAAGVDVVFEGVITAFDESPMVDTCLPEHHSVGAVAIEKVWQGCLPSSVDLLSYWGCSSFYNVGTRYIFWAIIDDDGRLVTNSCVAAGIPTTSNALDKALGDFSVPSAACGKDLCQVRIEDAGAPAGDDAGASTDEDTGGPGDDDGGEAEIGDAGADAGPTAQELGCNATSTSGGAPASVVALFCFAIVFRRGRRAR